MKIKAQKREIQGKKVKSLRKQDMLPASVYGPKREPMMLTVDPKEFAVVFDKAGTNQLITLEIGEGDQKSRVLVKEVQEDPVRREFLHVSFYEIDPTAKIVAEVPVVIEGVSPAVKNNIGFLVAPIDEIEVRCFPKDIPANFVIDISNLKLVGDNITLANIEVPADVEFVEEDLESTTLAYIAPPQKEIVEEEVEVEGEEGEEEEGEKEGDEEGEEKQEREEEK